MDRNARLRAAVVGVLALAAWSCSTDGTEHQEKVAARKTAITFYKALEEPSPAMQEAMGLNAYTVFGYPALVDGNLGWDWGVQKVEGGQEAYEVQIPFWCQGTSATGENLKLRRTMLVRLAADPAASGGWTITRFKFQDDRELTFLRQFLYWFLWMAVAPLVFYLALLFMFLGFWWPRVALMVAFFMGQPLRIYVSYVCFGSGGAAAVAMVMWFFVEMSVAKQVNG